MGKNGSIPIFVATVPTAISEHMQMNTEPRLIICKSYFLRSEVEYILKENSYAAAALSFALCCRRNHDHNKLGCRHRTCSYCCYNRGECVCLCCDPVSVAPFHPPPTSFFLSPPSNPFRCGIWMLLQVDVMPFLGRTDYGGTRALLVAVFFNTPVYSDCTAREWRLKTSRKMDRVPCSIV